MENSQICSKLVSLSLSVTFTGLDKHTSLLQNPYVRKQICFIVFHHAAYYKSKNLYNITSYLIFQFKVYLWANSHETFMVVIYYYGRFV